EAMHQFLSLAPSKELTTDVQKHFDGVMMGPKAHNACLMVQHYDAFVEQMVPSLRPKMEQSPIAQWLNRDKIKSLKKQVFLQGIKEETWPEKLYQEFLVIFV